MTHPVAENLLLLGDQARSARYVAICRHKAEDFARNVRGGAMLSKRLIFRDGWAIIKVAQGRRKIVIYTEAGFCTYEFFTSELIEPNYLYTPPYDGTPAFSVCGKGSFHKLGSTEEHTPLVNLCAGCDDDPGNPDPGEENLPYSLMSCETNAGLADMKTPDFWNIVKTQPYIWFNDFLGEKFVIGGHDNAPGYKQNRMLNRYNAKGPSGWSGSLYSVGNQIPMAFLGDQYTPYSQGGFTPGAGELMWGGALVHTANYELICCVDQNNNWKFWETGDWSVSPPPRLVTKAVGLGLTISHGLQTLQFNNDGTKAVAILTEYKDAVLDKSSNEVYKALASGSPFPGGLAYGSGNVGVAYGGSKTLAQEEQSWLIEYEINAYEDQGGDWQVDVTVGRQNRFESTGEWILAADYLGEDYAFDENTTYPAGSLVAAFFEVYYDNIFGLTNAGSYWPDDCNTIVSGAIKIKVRTAIGWDTIQTMVMQDSLRTYVQLSAVQDEYGNAQHGFVQDQAEGSDATSAHFLELRFDTINAMNLKNLSWVRYRFYQTNPTTTSAGELYSSAIEVWHENKRVHIEQLRDPAHDVNTFNGDPTWPRQNFDPLPAYAIELLAPLAYSTFYPRLRGQFAWHPKGHWATCQPLTPVPAAQDGDPQTDDFYMVDVVHAKNKTYSHKELYNNAFGDSRDYNYYNDDVNYRGVFMTAGLFRDP